jgi:segregation and condensation protein B
MNGFYQTGLGAGSALLFAGARPLRNAAAPSLHSPLYWESEQGGGHGEFGRNAQLATLEATLFLSDEPLSAKKLAEVARLADAAVARRLLRKLQSLYTKEGAAFEVAEIAGGFQLLTRPIFYRWLARLHKPAEELRLSGAALETLAIIGYRQPIMRADVEAIRGVQCGELLRLLMERGLVRIAGRHDSLGRPVLYGTTRKFLQVFGLKSLRDLPPIDAKSGNGE